MHFAIPEVKEAYEVPETKKGPYVSYSVFINGVYHCSLRYSQLFDFYNSLKAKFPEQMAQVTFPPKKMLSLSVNELHDRRKALEKFIQMTSQIPSVVKSSTFVDFFNTAQKEVQVWCEEVTVDVYFSNGKCAKINCLTTDRTDDILEAACKDIKLSEDLTYYFGLFLVQDNGEDGRVIRRLQEFESPYISMERVDKATHKLMIRRAYWDKSCDDALFKDPVAVNILYVQAAADIKYGRVVPDQTFRAKLAECKDKGNKAEYLRVMRGVRNANHEFVDNCSIDFPVAAEGPCSIGSNELRFHDRTRRKEYTFLITRMRCWKVAGTLTGSLELSFEYLKSQDKLVWITVKSSNAIHLSMTLQFMVDEMMRIRQGQLIRRPADRERAPKPTPRPKPADLVIVPAMPLEPTAPEEIEEPVPVSEPTSPHHDEPDRFPRSSSGSSGATGAGAGAGAGAGVGSGAGAGAGAGVPASPNGRTNKIVFGESGGARGESSTDDIPPPTTNGLARTQSVISSASSGSKKSEKEIKRSSSVSKPSKPRVLSMSSFSDDIEEKNDSFNKGIGDDDL